MNKFEFQIFCQKKQQSGSSLIEVLVTMIIVAVGLLGYAALMATTMRNSNEAYIHSQATFLANDVLERLRLNRSIAVTGNCNVALGAPPPASPNTLTNCNAVMRNDLGDWKTIARDSLPAGDASLTVNINGTVQVTIRWDENGDGTYTEFQTFSLI